MIGKADVGLNAETTTLAAERPVFFHFPHQGLNTDPADQELNVGKGRHGLDSDVRYFSC